MFNSIGFVLIVTLCQIGLSTQDCAWSNDWKRSLNQATCKGKSKHLAVIEEKQARYRAKCCSDLESLEFEKEELENCETTECIVGNVGSNNLCSSLPQYLTAEGERIQYEASLKDTCQRQENSRRSNGTTAVCCPKDSLAGLLVTTSAAEKHEFPYMASTGGCGATVYNKHFVISAAHCFVNRTTGNFIKGPHKVVLGTNIDELQSKSNTYEVAEIIVHERCSLLKGHRERNRNYKRYYNDIALLRLKKPINFRKDSNIRALEIAPKGFRPESYSDKALILGWGTNELGHTSEHLQKANVLFREDSMCFDRRRGFLGEKQYEVFEFADQLLCFGGIVNGSVSNSAGRGDSGGPAICRSKNGDAVLCGVASFGSEHDEEKCAEHRTAEFCQPSVYGDVGYFNEWIVQKAGRQDPDTLHRTKLYGEKVPRGKYLHQVRIITRDGMSCGGTLVALDTVVTAAHCVVRDNGEKRRNVRVLAGGREYGSGEIFYLPKFRRYGGLDKLNDTKSGRSMFIEAPYAEDIAVIKLDTSVSGVRRGDVAKLPTFVHFKPGRGTEVAFPLGEAMNSYLIQREFNILPRRECRKRLDRLHAVGVHLRMDYTKIMCGIEVFSGGSTCDRELGGGLICKVESNGHQDVLCGIQMFRMCEMTLPTAFLNVGRYLDFVQGVVNK